MVKFQCDFELSISNRRAFCNCIIFVTQHLAKSVDPDEMAHMSHLI